MMNLNSDQLEAFYQVAKLRSFSRASKQLNLSQPALSLRIKKLEEGVKTTLFIRENSGITLTDAGEKLFRYYGIKAAIESEVLNDIQVGDGQSLRGIVRVAGFSTIAKSILLPSLHDLVASQRNLQLEIHIREMHELAGALKKAEADFVLTEGQVIAENVESILLGHEENVLVESKEILPGRKDLYFDNDPEDQSTFNFFRQQTKNTGQKFRRSYLDEVYMIISAVEQGWGRAVLPRHLIQSNKKLRVISGFEIIKAPVYLSFYRHPFYTPLHKVIREQIERGFKEKLSTKR